MANAETAVQTEIRDALETAGFTVFRINSGRMRRRYKVAPTGWPDLVVVLGPDGHLVGLEVKVPGKEKPRESQEQMAAKFEAVGASYTIVSDPQGAIDALVALKGLREQARKGGAEWTNEVLTL